MHHDDAADEQMSRIIFHKLQTSEKRRPSGRIGHWHSLKNSAPSQPPNHPVTIASQPTDQPTSKPHAPPPTQSPSPQPPNHPATIATHPPSHPTNRPTNQPTTRPPIHHRHDLSSLSLPSTNRCPWRHVVAAKARSIECLERVWHWLALPVAVGWIATGWPAVDWQRFVVSVLETELESPRPGRL